MVTLRHTTRSTVPGGERRRVDDQVVVGELDELAHLVAHHEGAVVGGPQPTRDRPRLGEVDRATGVARLPRATSSARVETSVPTTRTGGGSVIRSRGLERQHGEGVGLLAGAAARAPDGDLAALSGGSLEDVRQQVVAQRVDLRAGAMEERLLDGDGVQQQLPLGTSGRPVEEREVGGHVRRTAHPEPFGHHMSQ